MNQRLENALFQISRAGFFLAFLIFILIAFHESRAGSLDPVTYQREFLPLINYHAWAFVAASGLSSFCGVLIMHKRPLVLAWVFPLVLVMLWIGWGYLERL